MKKAKLTKKLDIGGGINYGYHHIDKNNIQQGQDLYINNRTDSYGEGIFYKQTNLRNYKNDRRHGIYIRIDFNPIYL